MSETESESSFAPRMCWHLHEMMAKRGIRTATQLQRMLSAIGVQLSSAHISTLVNKEPKRVSAELMYGLTIVLNCSTQDLWSNPVMDNPNPIVEQPTGIAASMQRTAAAARNEPVMTDEEMVGPSVRAFPMPNANKTVKD